VSLECSGEIDEESREEEAERALPGHGEDTRLCLFFETNLPNPEPLDDSDSISEGERAHMVSRILRKYKHS